MMNKEYFENLLQELVACGIIYIKEYKGTVNVTFEDVDFVDERAEELENFFYEMCEGDFYLSGEIFGKDYVVGFGDME